jgi:RND family efflux transporter MFP subunit
LFACRHANDEREEMTPVAVRCVPAKREDMPIRVSLRGRVAAPPGADLPIASQVPGRIVQLLVKEGQHVAAGAIIAAIDDVASRDSARQAEASLAQAKVASANADATLQRTRELVARGYAARQELDDAVARADQAKAAINSASAGADLAQRTLGRVQVKTAFEGIVTKIWRGQGALVDGTGATPIAQIASSDQTELQADATDRQLATITEGIHATITLATGGAPIEGTVRARSSALDLQSGLGIVRIGLGSTAPTLGSFGVAALDVGKHEHAIVVPIDAMRGAIADGAEVVVCKNGKAEIRAVHVGERSDTSVEIEEGLSESDRIAIDHVLALENGTPLEDAK